MKLQMVGIDYEKANLDIRSPFSFRNEEGALALKTLTADPNISGAVILSTCNRTEIYVSAEKELTDLADRFCSFKDRDIRQEGKYLVERQGEAAMDHLFRLACGMRSRVFGEDQIVTQVKNALALARECQTTDHLLEKLFMNAITCAKRIKQTVHLTAVEDSVVVRMQETLEKEFGDLRGVRCLVIGNGMIGRMAASALLKTEADVCVTIRHYKTRQVEIPEGCRIIDYMERSREIALCDALISATTSPHLTVPYEEYRETFADGKKRVLIDLAVPRDISPEFALMPGISLYDIDHLGGARMGDDNEGVRQALALISEYEEKTRQDMSARGQADRIREIAENGGEITFRRIEQELNAALAAGDAEAVRQLVCRGTGKTLTAMLYRLNKVLDAEEWEQCLDLLNETMKAF